MPTNPDISVLIVNWRSGDMTRALVENLRRQRFTGPDGSAGTLEFIVTDNTCDASEEPHLEALEDDGVTVIRSKQNAGYATGMNLAAEHARGRFVLMSNPDVMAFRGALAAMVEHLETEAVRFPREVLTDVLRNSVRTVARVRHLEARDYGIGIRR